MTFMQHQVRALVIEGEVWFVEEDVIRCVPGARSGLSDVLNRDHLIMRRSKLSRGQGVLQANGNADELTLISEPGVIRLCLWQPSGASARKFVDWIIREASPSLRAAGLVEASFDTILIKRTRAEATKHKAGKVPHTLYRMFDEDDALLYVGISLTAFQRLMNHRSTKKWWREIARMDFKHYPSYETARDAERKAIAEEDPQYNIAA
jgi:prophage antirepressor-like protein